MRVEYKACIPQYEATQHQDIQETHWGMHADKLKLSVTKFHQNCELSMSSHPSIWSSSQWLISNGLVLKEILTSSKSSLPHWW